MTAPGPTNIAAAIAHPQERPEEPEGLPDRTGRPGRLAPENSSVITRRITAAALLLGLIMGVGKVWLFMLTGSVGVLSSLVHSALDVFAAASSFIAVRVAAMQPKDRYRFGFGKAESFSAVFQVCLIGIAAFHLFSVAFGRLDHGHAQAHEIEGSMTAIIVISTFILVTLGLLLAQTLAIRATGSLAVRGDRAHYLADMLGNLFVIIGLAIATFTEAHWADALVGVLMALWLLYTGWRVARMAWAQLMDRELPSDERRVIVSQVMSDPKIRAVSNLRTRAAGPHLHMQMRLDLDPTLPLSDAHDIVIAAEARLMAAFPAADILIHPHPVGCEQAHGNIRFSCN